MIKGMRQGKVGIHQLREIRLLIKMLLRRFLDFST